MNRLCVFSWMSRDEHWCRRSANVLYARLSPSLQHFPGGRPVELCLVNAYPGQGWLVCLLIKDCPPPVNDLSDPLTQWFLILIRSNDEPIPEFEQRMTTETDFKRLLPDNAQIQHRTNSPTGQVAAPKVPVAVASPVTRTANCYFCGLPAAPADQFRMGFFTIEDYRVDVPSYGIKRTEYSSRQYAIYIPRCKTCRRLHASGRILKKTGQFAFLAIILLLLNVNWLLALGSGLLIGCLIWLGDWALNHLPARWRHRLQRHAHEHPDAKALFAMGWFAGDKPNPSVIKK